MPIIIEQPSKGTELKGIVCWGCKTKLVVPDKGKETKCKCAFESFISHKDNSDKEICWGATDLRAITPIFG